MRTNLQSTTVVGNLAAKWFAAASVVCLMATFNIGCEAPSGAPMPLTCAAGHADCNGIENDGCETQLAIDRDNCGGCGKACKLAEVCEQSKCVPAAGTCPQGQMLCGTVCTNLAIDPANCGMCGKVCDAKLEKCESSACVKLPASCTNGVKDGDETDLDCGGSCKACGDGKKCVDPKDCASGKCENGVCVPSPAMCPMGLTMCNGACKDVNVDPLNCGACGTACDANTQKCSGGACVDLPPNCADGKKNGGESDIDCGGLCKACGDGKACNDAKDCASGKCDAGVCVAAPPCPPGLTLCGGLCKDATVDPAHCGGCGKACGPGESCEKGKCVQPVAADGGSDAGGADGGMGADGGANQNPDLATPVQACDPLQGLRVCVGVCVDTSSDGKNCGGCNNACKQGSVCSNFSCVPGCKPGETDCNGSCTDLQTDGRHCGGCNTPCAVNSVCVGGKCYEGGCPQGLTTCGIRACVNLLKDQYNCGGCNKVCAFNQVCDNGACAIAQCQQGRLDCNKNLVDGCEINTAVDVENCGACRNVCNLPHTAQWCWDGRCEVGGCFGTWRNCNGVPGDGCEADSAINLTHCGACGNTCPMVSNGTRGCSAGICGIEKCNAGFADCNASAKDGCEINTTSDSLHCGACGKACKLSNATSSCTAGACVIKKCDFGWEDCNGVAADGCEVNVVNNNANCGACNKQCTQGVCQVGQCVATCGPGITLCGNACVNTQTDASNCGGCGQVCAQGRVCQGGQCMVNCSQGLTQCGNACVNTQTDASNCGGCGKPCGQGQVCVGGGCQVGAFSVKVEFSCQASAEAHFYNNGNDRIGETPFAWTFNQAEACAWGVEIAARVAKSINQMMPWLGCDQGTPSLGTCTLKVNGVAVPLVDNNGKLLPSMFVHHPWACNNGGEGNIYLSLKMLGCPGA
jgi:hypothetical protein